MCNSLFRTGKFHFGADMLYREPKDGSATVGSVSQLRGILSHIYHVKKYHEEQREQDSSKGIERLVDRFVCFDKFHSLSKPLVVCEGKTDNIYLECALKSLAIEFPSMIEVAGGKTQWKIEFFKYSGGNMSIRGMSGGGAGSLLCLMKRYKSLMESFRCPGRGFPVILVADNDKGAKYIKTAAAKLAGRKIDGTTEFYRLVYNLYLVLLPRRCEDVGVEIEDLFEKSVLAREVGGKSFVRGDRADAQEGYGKKIFAEGVVRAGRSDISFEGLRPLLGRINKAIADYAKVGMEGD